MSKVVVFKSPKVVDIEETADPPLEADEVRICTLYSGISAGTELTAYRGSNPYLHKRWDPERRLFVPTEQPQLTYPVSGWGYEEVGQVVELGASAKGIELGDLVYGTWGHRSRHVVKDEYAAARILPKGLDPILGIFSQIGAIALNGIHDAQIRIGETVAVFGMGVPGQIVGQLARKSGARVIGVDLLPQRVELARQTGAVDIGLEGGDGVAERIRELNNGRGADVAIEASGFTPALNEAVRSVAYSAKVVALGFFQGNADGLYLGEEFHHNRINIICSQISGVSPDLSYRWDRLRLVHTVMRLQEDGALRLKPLISHIFPYSQASEAFERLDRKPADLMQAVLDFREA